MPKHQDEDEEKKDAEHQDEDEEAKEGKHEDDDKKDEANHAEEDEKKDAEHEDEDKEKEGKFEVDKEEYEQLQKDVKHMKAALAKFEDEDEEKEAKNEEDKEEAKEAKHSKDLHDQVAKLIKSQEKTNEVLAKFAKTNVRKTNLSSSKKLDGVEADVERNLKRFE